MNWSMMPHGMPQYSCSHFWQRSAFSFGLIASPYLPEKHGVSGQNCAPQNCARRVARARGAHIASSIVAVATSSDADDDRPPPSGTVEMTAASKPAAPPGSSGRYCATTPRM